MERLLGFDPQLLFDAFVTGINVFILFFALSYLLFNTVRDVLERRRQKIAGLIAVGGVKSYITNMNSPTVVDEFRYSVTSSSIAGLFTQGYMLIYHGSSVPAGWLVALNYIRNGAHVKLIVPSKMGQSDAMRDVHPYYYDLHKLQIWN